jgi:hypothetical protein
MRRASELPPGVELGPHTLKCVLTPAAQSRIFKEARFRRRRRPWSARRAGNRYRGAAPSRRERTHVLPQGRSSTPDRDWRQR